MNESKASFTPTDLVIEITIDGLQDKLSPRKDSGNEKIINDHSLPKNIPIFEIPLHLPMLPGQAMSL